MAPETPNTVFPRGRFPDGPGLTDLEVETASVSAVERLATAPV